MNLLNFLTNNVNCLWNKNLAGLEFDIAEVDGWLEIKAVLFGLIESSSLLKHISNSYGSLKTWTVGTLLRSMWPLIAITFMSHTLCSPRRIFRLVSFCPRSFPISTILEASRILTLSRQWIHHWSFWSPWTSSSPWLTCCLCPVFLFHLFEEVELRFPSKFQFANHMEYCLVHNLKRISLAILPRLFLFLSSFFCSW